MKSPDYQKLKQKWADEKLKRKQVSNRLKIRLQSKGVPILKRFGIKKAILFGSVQSSRCDEYSDTDLLVSPLSKSQYWDFRYQLEQSLEAYVDIYTQDDDPGFIQKVTERGVVIYEV